MPSDNEKLCCLNDKSGNGCQYVQMMGNGDISNQWSTSTKKVSYYLPGFHTDKILDMQLPPKEDPFCFCNLWECWKLLMNNTNPAHNLQEFMIYVIGNTLACPKSNCKVENSQEIKLANSSCSVNQCKHWNHNRCFQKISVALAALWALRQWLYDE